MKCKICNEKIIEKYIDGILKRMNFIYYREPGDWQMEFHTCKKKDIK